MKIDYSKKTYRLSLSLMCAAMTLVCLYIATLVPGGRLALYFLAGMLTIPLISEKELGDEHPYVHRDISIQPAARAGFYKLASISAAVWALWNHLVLLRENQG